MFPRESKSTPNGAVSWARVAGTLFGWASPPPATSTSLAARSGQQLQNASKMAKVGRDRVRSFFMIATVIEPFDSEEGDFCGQSKDGFRLMMRMIQLLARWFASGAILLASDSTRSAGFSWKPAG